MITTNELEIVNLFRQAAMSHPAVKWFDVGYTDFLFDSQRDLEFPCVFLQSNGVTNGDLRLTSSFTLYCLDLPLTEMENCPTYFDYQPQYINSRDTTISIINYVLGEVRGPNRQKFSLRRIGPAVPDGGQLDGATGYRINIEIEYDSILATVAKFPFVRINQHDRRYEQNGGPITLEATTQYFDGFPTLTWSSTDGGTIDETTGVVSDADVGDFTYTVTAILNEGMENEQRDTAMTKITFTPASETPVANPMITIDAHSMMANTDSGDIQLMAMTSGFTGTPTITWDSTDGGTISSTGLVSDDTAGTFTYRATATFGSETASATTTITWQTVVVTPLRTLTFDTTSFTGAGTANLVLAGDVGTNFGLNIIDATPSGWIDNSALDSLSGTIPQDGTFEATITIPANTNLDSETRTFRVQAVNTDDVNDFVNSATVSQIHTQANQQGDLIADFTGTRVQDSVTFTSNITGGDQPFTLELFDMDPSTGSPTPVETMTATALGTVTFTAIDVSTITEDTTYFLRVSDTDGDMLIESEVISPQVQEGFGFGNVFFLQSQTFQFTLPETEIPLGDRSSSYTQSLIGDVDGNLIRSGAVSVDSVIPSTLRSELGWIENVSEQTATLTIENSSSTEVFTDTFVMHNAADGVTLADVEVGSLAYSTNGSTQINVNFTTTDTSNAGPVTSYGVDYVNSITDDVPNGSNRESTSNIFINRHRMEIAITPLSSGSYSLRAWVSDGTDTTYGPVVQFTI